MATISQLVSGVHLLCFSSFCLRSSSFSLSRVSTFCWKISSCWLSPSTCPEQRNEIGEASMAKKSWDAGLHHYEGMKELSIELQESVGYLLVLASISVTFLLLSVSACFLESEKVTIILCLSFCFVLMKLYSVNI